MTSRPEIVAYTIAGALIALAVMLHRDQPVTLTLVSILILIATALAIVDITEQRLPDRLVLAAGITATAAAIAVHVPTGSPGRAIAAVGTGAAFFTIFLALSFLGTVGGGDIKYSYTIGTGLAIFGFNTVIVGVTIMFIGAAIAAAVTLARKTKSTVPFGPYMSLGLAAATILTTWPIHLP